MIDITPGIYVLTTNFENPRADKRKKVNPRWYDRPTYAAGERFVVNQGEGTMPTIRGVGEYWALGMSDPRVIGMLFDLRKVPDDELTVADILDVTGCRANERLIEFMLDRFAPNVDFRDVCDAYNDYIEADDVEEQEQLEMFTPEETGEAPAA